MGGGLSKGARREREGSEEGAGREEAGELGGGGVGGRI